MLMTKVSKQWDSDFMHPFQLQVKKFWLELKRKTQESEDILAWHRVTAYDEKKNPKSVI